MNLTVFSTESETKDEFLLSAYLNRFLRTQVFVFLVFLILPYLFFAFDVNILKFALAPGDGIVQGVPTKIYSARLEIWNQYSQSGTFPFKDIGWQTSYLPGVIAMRLFPNPFGYNLLLLFHYSLAGLFTFLFLRRLRIQKIAAFIGGLTFMFGGFLTSHKGHHTMMMAAAYLPIVLYLLESFLATGKRSWLFLAAFSFGLGILADYIAVSMYIGMVSFPYILFRVTSGTEFSSKSVVQKILSIIIYSSVVYLGGMMLAAIEILPIVESLRYITRQQISLEFFTSYSFSPKLLPLLFFPYIYGASSSSFYQILYFGPWNLTELAGYMGILPLLFAVLCFFLFRHKDRQVYFWTVIFLFAFLLVLGDSTPLYKLLYRVPIYNLFRAPARNWLEGNFATAILGSFFIHYVRTDSTLQGKRYYQIVHGVVIALIGVVFSILTFGKFLVQSPESLPLWFQNTRLTSPAIYVPLIIISSSIILVYLLFQNRQNTNFWVLIALTIFIDLFSFGHFHDTGYIRYKIFHKQRNSVAAFLNAADPDTKSYRIFSLNKTDYENQLYPSVNLLYGFSAVNGYSPIWLKDYANLTGFGTDGTVVKPRILYNPSILSVLSTKYIITADPADKAFLERILVNSSPGSDRIIVDGFHDKAWSFLWPAAKKSKSITLAVKESAPVSLMQYSFTPSAKMIYKITFSARMHKNQKANEVLAIDFFGENYDMPEQDTYIEPTEMSTDFRKFVVYLYSGEHPPASAFLRFITYSTFPYEIKDVQFVQSSGYAAYWGDKPFSGARFPIYEKKYESPEGIAVYENMNFLPRARFVKELIPVPNSSAAIYALRYNDGINPSDTALVEGMDFPHKLHGGQVIHADYSKDNVVTLSVKSGEYSFLVLSDSWYPGWKAFLDGEETSIYKTNAVSRGILIEGAGMHQVQFRFVPMSLYIGLGITIATTSAMITAILISAITSFGYRKQGIKHNSVYDAGSGQR